MLGKAIAGCTENVEGEITSNCAGLLTVNSDYTKCFKTPVVDETVLGKIAALPGLGSAAKPKILSPSLGYLGSPPAGSCRLSSPGPQGAQCKLSDTTSASTIGSPASGPPKPSVTTSSGGRRVPAFTKPPTTASSAAAVRLPSVCLAFVLFVVHRQR